MEIEYSSNNSGGQWWLKDEHWKALEDRGWTVKWVKKDPEETTDRFMGALAMYASKEFEAVREALLEFEEITGAQVSEEGCNCCGPPHSFSWEGGYCSGESCLSFLYDEPPASLREACEQLNRQEV